VVWQKMLAEELGLCGLWTRERPKIDGPGWYPRANGVHHILSQPSMPTIIINNNNISYKIIYNHDCMIISLI